MAHEKGKSRGNVKVAPAGYYTAQEAAARLGLNRNTFRYYVRNGKIKRHVPPMRTEGFYDKKEIDRLATEFALFFHTSTIEDAVQQTETRVVRPEDAPGIYSVLADGFGWQTAPVALRLEWYKVNPCIDYVVLSEGRVIGYITAVPYSAEALAKMMSGQYHAWHMKPDDILSYLPGRTYDLYVGAAVRQDEPEHTRLAFRLLSGFMAFLEELAEQHIIIRRMYAVSDQKDGQQLCNALGFVQQPAEVGDAYPRYMLDLETADSRFAQRYREAIKS